MSALVAVCRSLSSCSTRLVRVRTMTIAPETSSAVASRIPSVSSSRARSVSRSVSGSLGAQRVAEAADGSYQRVVVCVEFATQIADVRLDHVVVAVEVVLPHVVEYLLLGQH